MIDFHRRLICSLHKLCTLLTTQDELRLFSHQIIYTFGDLINSYIHVYNLGARKKLTQSDFGHSYVDYAGI